MVTVYRRGCSVRVRTELCARKEDFGSGKNRTVCVEDGYSLDDNICVFNGDDSGISA